MDEMNIMDLLVEDTIPTEESETKEEAVESAPETVDEVAPEEAPTTDLSEEQPETVDYKFNHKVTQLDRKAMESIAAALGMDIPALTAQMQKGAGYDAKAERLAEIENTLDEYAQDLNVDRKGIFKLLETAGDRAALRTISAQVKAAHPDWADSAVMEVSKMALEQRKQNAAQNKSMAAKKAEEESNRPFVEFFLRHPDITPDNMSEEMKQDIMDGLSPEEAFYRQQSRIKDQELETVKEELAQLKQQTENKRKAIGSVNSEVGQRTDDLSAAFLSAFR